MSGISHRIRDSIELEVFLFQGLPEGRHRDRFIQRQRSVAVEPKGPTLGYFEVNFETGEFKYTAVEPNQDD